VSIEEILDHVSRPSTINVHSDDGLAGSVEKTAADDDKARQEKGTGVLRRKPGLKGLPSGARMDIDVSPWHLLHTLGRTMTLSRQGAARGLAEHWGSLKYILALEGQGFLRLSQEGTKVRRRYAQIQSDELGSGIALVVAKEILRRRYPDRFISVLRGRAALHAGWRKLGDYYPNYLLEAWKPGEPSLVVPVMCKGFRCEKSGKPYKQLASASAHVERVHIGPWNETPSMVFSTEFSKTRPLTLHALASAGKGGWLTPPPGFALPSLNEPAETRNAMAVIQPPGEGDSKPASVPGCHVKPVDSEFGVDHAWFQQVCARTDMAALAAFTGDNDATARYLTAGQGRKDFVGHYAHAASDSVRDVDKEILLGATFTGTDHVFRLNGERVEAFSGVATDLFEHLKNNDVEQYRRQIYARRTRQPTVCWDSEWGGLVSIHNDGTALAIRRLRATECSDRK
jgi:hypothetical protein